MSKLRITLFTLVFLLSTLFLFVDRAKAQGSPCGGTAYCRNYCGASQCNTRLTCDCVWRIIGGIGEWYCNQITCSCYSPTTCPDGSRICSGSCPSTGGGGGGGGGGGWGGCGSCGSCGGPSSECVTDPGGGCQWDPGTCAGGGGPPPCSPDCGPFCGQDDGCGGTCADTDYGPAGTPTISSPTDGSTAVTDASGNVTVDWNNTGLADRYVLEVYASSNPDVDWTSVGGAISSTGAYSTGTRTRAFDLSTGTYWRSQETGPAIPNTAWIGQDFTKNRHIRQIKIKQHASDARYRITSAHLQYSDNNSTWTTAETLALPDNGVVNTIDVQPSDAHRYWRLLANDQGGNGYPWLVYDLEMRVSGEAISGTSYSTTPSQYTFLATGRDYTVRARALNTTCVAGGQSSEWSRWVTFTALSPVSGSVWYDGNNTATLTGSNTCTGVGASLPATSSDITTTTQAVGYIDYSATYNAPKAYDNSNTTYWASRQVGAAVNGVSWIGQNFGAGNEKEIRKITVRQYNNSLNRVTSVYVEHSDNGTNWTTLQTLALTNNGNTNAYFLNASSNHQYWRLRAASGVGSGRVWAVHEIEMFEISAVDLGTLTVTGQDYQQYSDQVTVLPDGTYSINLPYSNTGTNQVSLVIDNAADFICSCPIGCSFSGVNAPLAGLDFYITDAREPWFQTIGGSVAALGSEGTVLTDPIPNTCASDPDCTPFMMSQRDDQASSSGLVLTGGGDVDLDRDTGLQTETLDEDNTRRVGKVNSRVAQERYEYFYRLYKFGASPTSDFGETAVDAQKPTAAPVNTAVNAYYHNGDLTILDPWSIAAGETVVIFVDGDLNVKNTVLVELTGFLAFIVRGDIIFDANIGHVDPTAPTANDSIVEGIYIANGILSLPSRGAAAGGDYKFVGEGTFVGWSGVELDRNYDDNVTRRTLNNTNPIEVFRYRPDFIVRAPDEMRVPRILWREVAP